MQTVSPDLSRRPAWRSVAAYLRSHLAEFWDHYIALLIVIAAIVTAGLIKARPPKISVTYQPTVGDGLAGRHPFEALLTLDRSTDPSVPGYAIPAGATIRFSFPEAFAAQAGAAPSAVLLHAWSQGPIPASFTIVRNDAKPGEIAIRFHEAIAPRPPEAPGLKAIHLWTDEVNPSAGDYPITVEFANAGPLFGTTTAIAHITPAPVSSIGAYNRLHDGRNEDWQHVMPGAEARIPIDFVATLPDGPGAAISLRRAEGGSVIILANGEPVGWIRTEGAPVNLTPEMLGPDLARLGSHASARPRPGLRDCTNRRRNGRRHPVHDHPGRRSAANPEAFLRTGMSTLRSPSAAASAVCSPAHALRFGRVDVTNIMVVAIDTRCTGAAEGYAGRPLWPAILPSR